jgi:hypothetical protein
MNSTQIFIGIFGLVLHDVQLVGLRLSPIHEQYLLGELRDRPYWRSLFVYLRALLQNLFLRGP